MIIRLSQSERRGLRGYRVKRLTYNLKRLSNYNLFKVFKWVCKIY